jgi:hypothetical protein
VLALAPTGRWHLFTTPAILNQAPQLPPEPDLVHLSTGQYVPAPPSTRGALGHDTWLAEQRRRRLPPWPPVVTALTRAAEQLQHRQPTRHRAATR